MSDQRRCEITRHHYISLSQVFDNHIQNTICRYWPIYQLWEISYCLILVSALAPKIPFRLCPRKNQTAACLVLSHTHIIWEFSDRRDPLAIFHAKCADIFTWPSISFIMTLIGCFLYETLFKGGTSAAPPPLVM